MHKMQKKMAVRNILLKRMMPTRDWLINSAGCLAAKWVLHNVIKPAIYKATEVIKVGDVVTDNGYHGEVVVTCITYDTFKGFYKADGVVVSGLRLEDFKKIVAHIDLKIGGSR